MQHLNYRSGGLLLTPDLLANSDAGLDQITDLLKQMAIVDLATAMVAATVRTVSLPIIRVWDHHNNDDMVYSFDEIVAYRPDYEAFSDEGALDQLASLARLADLNPLTHTTHCYLGLFMLSESNPIEEGSRDEYVLRPGVALDEQYLQQATERLADHPAATVLAEVIRLGATRRNQHGHLS